MPKILTKSQFESQAFKYWLRTGFMYNYEYYKSFLKKELQKKFEIKESESNKYIWTTAGDEKVRDTHATLDGEVLDWETDLRPGQDYGCRCVAIFVDSDGYPTGVVGRCKYNQDKENFEEEIEDLISSNYGELRDGGKIHSGIDFRMPEGSIIRAVKSGKVERSGWEDPNNHYKGYGLRIQILNQDKTFSEYGHMSEIFVNKGEYVEIGQEIGRVGNTGHSFGPHLHYTERDSNYDYIKPEINSIRFILNIFSRQKNNPY